MTLLTLQNLEVVPLFGDMQIAPFNYIKRSKNFDAKMWPMCSASSISPQADLMCHLPRIREEHIKYISELARYSNEVRQTDRQGVMHKLVYEKSYTCHSHHTKPTDSLKTSQSGNNKYT